ncbi:hypothetical protein CLOM_g7179 [Closterium sp. NIES-68]|nr:hypothetical protein CLOM_g7179 [Closterium sp. NIES-68]GJP78984.1 hypothetical protein CLOP_g9241 [Closterium sp. NIES-67]
MAALYSVLAHRAARGVSRFHNKVVGVTVPSADRRFSAAAYSDYPGNRRTSLQQSPQQLSAREFPQLPPLRSPQQSPQQFPPMHLRGVHSCGRQFSTSAISSAGGTIPSPGSPAASPSPLPTHGEGMVLGRAAVSAAYFTAHFMDGGVEEVLESRSIHVAAAAASTGATSFWPGTGQLIGTRHAAGRFDQQPSASFAAGGRSELRETDVKDDGGSGGGEGRADVIEGGGGSGEAQGRAGESGEGLGGKSHAPEVESATSLHSQRSMAEHTGAVRGGMQGEGAGGGKGEAETGGEGGVGVGRDGSGANGGKMGGNGGRGEGAVWVDDMDGKGYVSLGRPTNVNGGSAEGLLGDLAHVAPMDRLDSARLAEPEPDAAAAPDTEPTTAAAAPDEQASCPHAATGLVGADGGKVVNAMGMRVRVKAEAEQTGGSYSVMEYEVLAGEGSEEHIHTREHEAWFLLDGQMTWTIEQETYQATQGSFMHMPLGRAHSFRNDSGQPARMLVVCMPGGLEKYFLEIGEHEAAAGTASVDGASGVDSGGGGASRGVQKPVVNQDKLQHAIKKAMLYGLVYPKGAAA